MKKITAIIPFVFVFFQLDAQFMQNAISIGDTEDENVIDVVSDNTGHWYVAGNFSEFTDLNPYDETFEILSIDGGYNSFICRYASNFTPELVVTFDGLGISRIAVDSNQSIYLSGSFNGSVDVDPGEGEVWLSSVGGSDGYVCKLDENMNLLWARSFGGINNENNFDLVVSADGRAICAGQTESDFALETANGQYEVPGAGTFGIPYAISFDQNGMMEWGAAFTGDLYLSMIKGLAIDSQGGVYLTGSFDCVMDADPGPNVYNFDMPDCGWDNYIIKLNTIGELDWAHGFGTALGDSDYAWVVEVSPNDVVSITGRVVGAIDVDPSANEYIWSEGGAYILHLNISGEFVDLWEFPANVVPQINELTYDNEGNAYCFFTCGTCDFDPGEGVESGNGEYLVKIDASGQLVGTYDLNISGLIQDFRYAINPLGNVVAYTEQVGQAIVPTINGDVVLSHAGANDMTFLLISPCSESGCMDETACNYDPLAQCDSGVCSYASSSDFDCDGEVDINDLMLFINNYGCTDNCGNFDLNSDFVVGSSDLMILIGDL